MGNCVSCCFLKQSLIHKEMISKSESFVNQIWSSSKLSKITISELLQSFSIGEISSLTPQSFDTPRFIDFTEYSRVSATFFYEPNVGNKYYVIHSIVFAFIATSFSTNSDKIKIAEVIRHLSVYTISTKEEKVDLFVELVWDRIEKGDVKNCLKILVVNYLRFLLKETTSEIAKIIFNSPKFIEYINPITHLANIYTEETINRFAEFVLLDSGFRFPDEVSDEANLKSLIKTFFSEKNFLFDPQELRRVFSSFSQSYIPM